MGGGAPLVLGQRMHVHAEGEGAAVGVAELGGDIRRGTPAAARNDAAEWRRVCRCTSGGGRPGPRGAGTRRRRARDMSGAPSALNHQVLVGAVGGAVGRGRRSACSTRSRRSAATAWGPSPTVRVPAAVLGGL